MRCFICYWHLDLPTPAVTVNSGMALCDRHLARACYENRKARKQSRAAFAREPSRIQEAMLDG